MIPRILVDLRKRIDLTSLEQSARFDRLDENTQRILVALLDNQASVLDGLKDQTLTVSQLLNRMDNMMKRQQQDTRVDTNLSQWSNGTKATSTTELCIKLNERGPKDTESNTGRNTIAATETPAPEQPLSSFELCSEEEHLRHKAENLVLRSLKFATMTEHYEAVSEAYFHTLEWIFKDSLEGRTSNQAWSNFGEWLRDGSGIYWVNGKAGSGKSTLMRFICDKDQTQTLLRSWAHPLPLTTASFFFWNSGTVEQASQAGLLRSLLYTILREHKNLIPAVLPWHWAKCYSELASGLSAGKSTLEWEIDDSSILSGISWPLSKLTVAFRQLLKQDDLPFKVCLFIDGLDEYEGNIEEVCQLFQNVAEPSHVKICASSRPLLIIEDLYGGFPKLRLQDLTTKDIEFYIRDNLNNNSRFRQLSVEEPLQTPALMSEIAERADGVFLWVRLVVRSLLDGLGNHDGIDDLRRRLNLLPTDLEELYKLMLQRLNPFYLAQASEFFQILRAAREVGEITHKSSDIEPNRKDENIMELGSMTILTLVSISSTGSDLLLPSESSDEVQSLLRKAKAMVTKIKSRGAMLIEVDESHSSTPVLAWKVRYLHRTVRNFLESSDMRPRLLSYTAEKCFDPHTELLRSCVYQLKMASILREEAQMESISVKSVSVSTALAHAYYSYAHNGKSNANLLDHLNRLLKADEVARDLTEFVDYARPNSILPLAIQYGLVGYVREKLVETPIHLKPSQDCAPLLDYAIAPKYNTGFYRFSAELVSMLLEYGANPNKRYKRRSPWENALLWHYQSMRRAQESGSEIPKESVLERIKMFRVLLERGAKPNAYCWCRNGGSRDRGVDTYSSTLRDVHGDPALEDHRPLRGYRSAWFVITNAFMASCTVETIELQHLLRKLGAKQHVSYAKMVRMWILYHTYNPTVPD